MGRSVCPKVVRYRQNAKGHDCVEEIGKSFILCSRSLPTDKSVDGR